MIPPCRELILIEDAERLLRERIEDLIGPLWVVFRDAPWAHQPPSPSSSARHQPNRFVAACFNSRLGHPTEPKPCSHSRTATPAINDGKWRHSAALSEIRAVFLNGAQRSVNRKVQGSNPWSGAKPELETGPMATRGLVPYILRTSFVHPFAQRVDMGTDARSSRRSHQLVRWPRNNSGRHCISAWKCGSTSDDGQPKGQHCWARG